MYKIGEFSRISFVTVQALRHYDEIGLFKPAKVEEFSGYRYYTADQLPRIQYISALKNLGLSLDEISALVNDDLDTESVKNLFILKRAELRQIVENEQKRLAQVEQVLQQITVAGGLSRFQISTKKVEPMIVASIRNVLPEYSGMQIAGMFQELIGFVLSGPAKPAGPTMLMYRDDEYRELEADIEVAFCIDRMTPGTGRINVYELPAIEQAATVVFEGAYDGMGEAYNAVMNWVTTNGYHIDGACRELYLVSPGDTDDPSKYVSEIQIPITEASSDEA